VIKILRSILFCQVIGFTSANAQYSHFPITHFDWELIDFEKLSPTQPTAVVKNFESLHSSHVKWEQSSTAKPSLTPCNQPTEIETVTHLSRLVKVEPSEPNEGESYDFFSENHESVTTLDQTEYSLSAKILRFLHSLLETDENSSRFASFENSLDGHSWIWKPKYLHEQEYQSSAIFSSTILQIAHPFHHPPPSSLDTTNISNSSNHLIESKANKDFTVPNKKTEENYSRPQPNAFFNVFAAKFDEGNLQDRPYYFQRQRRANYTYVWEMTDFDDYNSTYNDTLAFSDGNYSNDTFTIIIKPLKDGAAVGTGDLNNSSATQGVANNMPVFPDNGIWSPSSRTYSNFLTFTNSTLPTVNVDASAVKYFMNWYYGDWEAEQNGNNFNLVYYSAAPEPSTYVMTGALVCFIGLNGRSRKAAIQLASALLMKLKFRQSEKNSTQLNAVS